jgi:hypothetical protein
MKARRNIGPVVLASIALLVSFVPDGSLWIVSAISPARLPLVDANAGWEEVGPDSASGGGISNNSGHSYFPSPAFAPDGTLYVAWQDDSSDGNPEIYVRRWTEDDWEEVGLGSASDGGISDNSGDSLSPSAAVAPDGTLYVAWYDTSGGDEEIYVRCCNETGWTVVGAGSASGGGISNNSGDSVFPSLAIAPNGTPYVAWQDDSSGGGEIYVRRWNGSRWAEVGSSSASGGGISNNSGWSANPSLAIAPNGTPYIAWEDETSGDYEIYVRRWNGSEWESVGAVSASGGGISVNNGMSLSPSMAIAPDSTPYVAWYDYSEGNPEVYVRRWNGDDWEEVGAGSASGGGISNNSGLSQYPSLVFASDGTAYVAWYDFLLDDAEIYVRLWNEHTWEEARSGSASGGGISDNSGGSYHPVMTIAPDGIPHIAWYDYSGGNAEIYVRRWRGGSDTDYVYLPILLKVFDSN